MTTELEERAPLSCRLKGPVDVEDANLIDATTASLTAKLAEIDQERDRADNAQAYANEQFIRAEAAEAKSARLEAALKPFALPNGWHFIAYNKTGSTACPLNAGEVELARAALAGGGQATPGSGGTVDGGGCDL